MVVQRWVWCLVAALATCTLVPSAAAQTTTTNSDTSFPHLQTIVAKAKEGSLKDQTKLGDYYLSKSDFTNAVVWYRRAAEQGEPEAMLSLASCYATGRGVARNPQESTRWLRQAATRLGDKLEDVVEATAPAPTNSLPVVADKVTSLAPAEACAARSTCQRVHVLERIDPSIVQTAPAIRPASFD
jgi:hypothetical protein